MKPNIMCESAWVNVRSADWVILEENPNRIWGHTILKNFSEYLGFVTLSLNILEKTKLHLWRFRKIVLHSLKFPRPKNKTHGNSIQFFHDYPKKFLFFLDWLVEFPHAISSIFLENPYPHPPSCPSMFGYFLE